MKIKVRVWNGEQMVSPDYIDRNGVAHWKENSIPTSSKDTMLFTGLKDKNGVEIYSDDILFDGEHKYRVYAMCGGFTIKAPYWAKNMEDVELGDYLIMQPLSDAQTFSYIHQSCEVIGNVCETSELLKDE